MHNKTKEKEMSNKAEENKLTPVSDKGNAMAYATAISAYIAVRGNQVNAAEIGAIGTVIVGHILQVSKKE
jgi:hypothetical protein